MHDIPLAVLFIALFLLLMLSAFFSSSETGLMSINRYRLRHLAKNNHRGAMRASRLLETPDKLIGLILLGNNFVNVLASSIATIIALRLGGEAAIAIAAGLLTFALLIFSEVAPKTAAAFYPEKIAFPAAFVYTPLLKLLYPVVWLVNLLANGLLKLFKIDVNNKSAESLSREELRTVVNEAGSLIPKRHQTMLLSILDLENVTVEDIMIPRNEIAGVDLNNEIEQIAEQLKHSHHTRLPVFRDNINQIEGFLHIRSVLTLLAHDHFTIDTLLRSIQPTYFVPETTPLNTQLLNFQRQEKRIAMAVDEYGDIQGLVTLEDILEEIVGKFTSEAATTIKDIHPQKDGSYLVDGSANIRDLNRMMKWSFPVDGPKTFNGLITEHLESIPELGITVKISGYPIEVVQIQGNTVKTARILTSIKKHNSE